MKLLYVTSEANPFAASGGLGDVMGALPPEIQKLSGADVAVILPLYDTTRKKYGEELERCIDISFNLSWRKTGASVFKITKDCVDYFFVENHYYFDRPALYGEWDDGERFAFFSMAVIEFMLATNNIPDILHANDWQSALSVIYLKTKYKDNPLFNSLKTVYTIHNIEYQGKYGLEALGDIFALDDEFRTVVQFDSCVNLMKGALICSDYVSTVSPNYANELQYEFFSFGLSGVIREIREKLCGIINGIDYNYFSPYFGGDIDFPYDKKNYKEGKAKNKFALQNAVGLEPRADVPLIVMITRLASQKGIDLVAHILPELLKEDIQFVILGTGEKEYEDYFISLEEHYPNMKALIRFDRVISKKMYASADLFLMPSKSEPCGLAQMIACSYGTVPLVRAVGGLYDSIIPYGMENANGFNFSDYNAHELLYKLKEAIGVYKDKVEWNSLVKRAINSDFSWTNSANKYLELYNNLITDRK